MWLVGALLLALSGVSLAATSTVMHPAFKNAGTQDGIKIWRIESFEPVPVNPSEFGKFYSGDSYIILSTHEDKSNKGRFTWDIHYWLGEKTSQDESGAAAILSVELDDQLGGGPVQHREVQDHESQKFLAYFKNGVRYMPGGAASGFNHITINDPGEKKLYQIKGKKNVRVRQVEMSAKSLNKGDCFILDAGNEIFVYVGSSARGTERVKAISAANGIRDQDHSGRAKINIIDGSSSATEVAEFFTKLGSGSPSDIQDEATAGTDEEFEKSVDNTVTLYKVSDAGGKLVSEKVSEKPLKQAMLKTEDCFILDTVKSGIYVWIGKKATTQEKVESLKRGESFIAQNNYPRWTKMRRVVEGAEPTAFKEYFGQWTATVPRGGGEDAVTKRVVRSVERCGAAKAFMPDSGQGSMEVYRVENLELAPVDEASYGVFFAGDSYVIKYEYTSEYGAPKYIIYFWQGKDSTNDEKAASALLAVKLDDELSGKAIQIRVAQGEEPAHFLKIFNGKLIVLAGGKASGFRNIRDYDTYDTDGTRLFQIMGTCPDDMRAIQVPEVAASLNSNDVFLLETPELSFLWIGKGCSREEEMTGEWAKDRLCPDRDLVKIAEGDESPEFWQALGGPDSYNNYQPDIPEDFEPILYHCYINSVGRFKYEEIPQFSQQDLYSDDIMALDTGDEMYLWIGKDSSDDEKRGSYQMARRLASRVRGGKDPVIITIKQGQEMPYFTRYFPDWDDSYWENTNQYENLKNIIDEFNRNL